MDLVVIQQAITAVTALAAIASISALAFKVGSWKTQMESDHEDVIEGHRMVHEDIDILLNEVNGFEDASNRDNCSVCDVGEENSDD